MGTNYYANNEEGTHLGKTSAAGWYCFDCDETLVMKGKKFIHQGGPQRDECPECGASKADVEASLGRKTSDDPEDWGPVRPTYSFSWAVNPMKFFKGEYGDQFKNEYGEELDVNEMKKIIYGSPLQIYDSIGEEFS
jgi:hypothetical protein